MKKKVTKSEKSDLVGSLYLNYIVKMNNATIEKKIDLNERDICNRLWIWLLCLKKFNTLRSAADKAGRHYNQLLKTLQMLQ